MVSLRKHRNFLTILTTADITRLLVVLVLFTMYPVMVNHNNNFTVINS